MVKLNKNIIDIDDKNTFLSVKEKVIKYRINNPEVDIISLGVGDVSRPIVKPVIDAMHKAVDDLASVETFKGYDTNFGYNSLKTEILSNDYNQFNFTNDEIYISCGGKTDVTSILELFDENVKICVSAITYPVYVNGANCLGRKNITVLDANEENNFIPDIPKEKYDIIYICSPGNPTGTCYSYKELTKWVNYARENNSIIFYDNVYHSFISSIDVPKSIYEIEEAKEVAIEFRSFSKQASFTGVRCSYYVIPNDICLNINKIWQFRTTNRFNGSDYIAQMGAVATYLNESKVKIGENINYYKKNVEMLRNCFVDKGYHVFGGNDAPYLWIKIKDKMSSWELFNFFLKELNIVVIPGIVFGNAGDKYFRVSGLAARSVIQEAIKRIEKYYEKANYDV